MPFYVRRVQKVRVIDYEKILAEDGRRIVAFGQYAGTAGRRNFSCY